MGNVAISIKIMPESAQTDLEKVRQEISKKMKIQDFKIEPIAFGLKSLKILVIAPDTGTENIKEQIEKIKGVSNVEIESQTLI